MSGMTQTFEVTLPASLHAPSMARDALRRSWPGGRRTDRGSDAELLVSELVTNCVRHAGLAEGRQISFVLALAPEHLRVEVIDVGRGFSRLTSTGADRDSASGWGLLLVERLSDDWGMSRSAEGETTVWFEMRL